MHYTARLFCHRTVFTHSILKCDVLSYIDLMSPTSYRTVRLSKQQALKQIRRVIQSDDFSPLISIHAKERMKQRNITISDVLNVLRSLDARISDGELHSSGAYGYKLSTKKYSVVVSFSDDGEGANIVTVMEAKKL